MEILLYSNLKYSQLYWITVEFCIPKFIDKGLVLSQITFVVSQSQYALDTGTVYGCFLLLLAYETLYCFDLSTATALLLCEILLFVLYSAILEAVTQSPLKNLPSRALQVSFII